MSSEAPAQVPAKRKQEDSNDGSSAKKSKPTILPTGVSDGAKPITGADLSSLKKAKRDPSERSKPTSRRHERTPPRQRSRSPPPISRSPSRSPPRQRKRPGVSGRGLAENVEVVRRRQEERERVAKEAALAEASRRGQNDLVTQHYNSVPERGRQWRQSGSMIKGLRSFNNWVKSALIQKFSPSESYVPGARQYGRPHDREDGLRVLDIGCGKGGDLQKWQNAPQGVEVYVGLDPAAVSIEQARGRYQTMPRFAKFGEFRGRPLFHAEFMTKDCYGETLENVPIARDIGLDYHTGPAMRGGGFDVVSMMFCMHYAFENEQRARGMLRNVAAALKRGGRFLGVIPNSDVLSAKVKALANGDKATPAGNQNGETRSKDDAAPSEDVEEGEWDPEKPAEALGGGAVENAGSDDEWDPEKPSDPQVEEKSTSRAQVEGEDGEDEWDPEKPASPAAPAAEASKNASGQKTPTSQAPAMTEGGIEWGNSMYRVKFPGAVPKSGVFRPSYGWRYFFFLEEAVEEVPEYVVPWEAFRAMAIDYDLELHYRKPFHEIWNEEKDDRKLGELSERMGVRDRATGELLVSKDELEASSFYHAFCFYKV